MSDTVKKTLNGGPCDGEVVEIHRDNLKIKPRINVTNTKGVTYVYGLDDNNQFVWLPDPDDPKVTRGWFVCDDDGNVISEERTDADALRRLDEFNDDSDNRRYNA